MLQLPREMRDGFEEFVMSAASSASLVLAPFLAFQGAQLRKNIPRLPGAAGPTTGRCPQADGELRLMVVGESSVAGVGAPDHAAALTGQIAEQLWPRINRPVHWQAYGKIGATAEAVRLELIPKLPRETVDILVLALGVNDVIKLHSPKRWTRDLAALIESARERVGPVPIVLAPVPPLGQFPIFPQPLRSVLGLRASALELASRKLAGALERVVYCGARLEKSIEHLFCIDRFHPSLEGYRLCGRILAEAIAPLVRKA